jgi:hypothetical protein
MPTTFSAVKRSAYETKTNCVHSNAALPSPSTIPKIITFLKSALPFPSVYILPMGSSAFK